MVLVRVIAGADKPLLIVPEYISTNRADNLHYVVGVILAHV